MVHIYLLVTTHDAYEFYLRYLKFYPRTTPVVTASHGRLHKLGKTNDRPSKNTPDASSSGNIPEKRSSYVNLRCKFSLADEQISACMHAIGLDPFWPWHGSLSYMQEIRTCMHDLGRLHTASSHT